MFGINNNYIIFWYSINFSVKITLTLHNRSRAKIIIIKILKILIEN